MINAIYAGRSERFFTEIIEGFQAAGIHITPVTSGEMAFNMLSDASFDMLITDDTLGDMSGKDLIEKTVQQRPFMNFAVTGDMPEKQFHDAYEGLGVLMQLPCPPSSTDAKKLAERTCKISGMMAGPTQEKGAQRQ